MKLNTLLIIFISSLFFSCSTPRTLDELLIDFEKENKAMGTISIFKDDKEVFNKSFGLANLEKNKKANDETKYWIGSITKTYTAAVILNLVDEKKLSYDTKLNDFFPDIKNSENITITQLLKHRSGLYNITKSPNFESWIAEPRSRLEMISKLNEFESEFNPGEKTSYSNSNFIVLSYIAEIIEKKPFKEILNERIFTKLNLKRTAFADTLNITKNEAMDYFPENGKWSPITYQTNLLGTMGAGGIISTAKEINIFYNALFSGKLLSKEALKEMTTPINELGMGLGISEYEGLKTYGHDGRIDGFRSIAMYAPEKNFSIVLTFNASKVSMKESLIRVFEAYKHTYETAF
ncbi:beta-lactamase family protein [Polaribacter haliotis]|uniref:Beta-lactamase family protein n=1 Tax=Polaribacter haliotis TaxID=1888915 RepID=A0A7L8AFD2_9FLAO|nr:serine hydrolase domain-containing protein [Polaribacter haliotis]QOD60519.1 beta-lactamase family protein [Polaribacter haliotis]